MSSGVSSAWPISCRITPRSTSMSGASNSGFSTMSARMSSARGTSACEHPGVVGGHLLAGIGVDVAADVLDLLGDRLRAARRRALEGHVLEEMGDAVLLGALVPAAGGQEHPDRRRVQPRHRLDGDPEAVRAARGPRPSSHRLPADHVLDRRQIVRDPRHPLGPGHQVRHPRRQRRPHAAGGLDRVGELRGMRGGEHHHRHRRVAAPRRAACRPTAVCGQTTSPVAR